MTTYRIAYKKNIPKGFIGNNYLAAKVHNLPFEHKAPSKVIEIKTGLPSKTKFRTIQHEKAEVFKMQELIKKGYSPKRAYHKAHYNFALPFEETGKRFPTANVRTKLKKMGFNR